ncbi:MAG TPA: PepSY-associated TM helix domain-containing protein [Lacunisphaera sp.]
MRIRPILFWLHLVAGLTAGLVIGIMCFTGAALAFEKDLVAWSERDARRVTPPAANVPRLTLTELAQRVNETKADAQASGIVVSRDPRDAVTFMFGRDSALYVNPYTGEVRTPASTWMHDTLQVLEDWHRVLAVGGDNRPVGKAINGACNIVFFFLAVSGLYLWWPRTWSWPGLKAVAVFNWKLAGKARDFNWHNAIGLWSAPILIVLTLTATPISYRWAGNLIYQLAGEEPPPIPGAPGGNATATPSSRESSSSSAIKPPSLDARPLDRDAFIAAAQRQLPDWQTITFRLANPQRNGGQPAPRASVRPNGANANGNETNSGPNSAIEDREPKTKNPSGRSGVQPVTLIVKTPGTWPRTATTTLTLDPYTSEMVRTEGFSDLTTGRQIRTWSRFLHTGEALGVGGQLLAGLACLGGCVLVYTGFALACRRFLGRKAAPPSLTSAKRAA